MKFVASRMSSGNKMFPTEIHLGDNGITIKIPGVFNSQSRYMAYNQIGEVTIDTPLVGFSTIHFYTAGTQVKAHGFTKAEVTQIKEAVEKGQTK
jgi:hypothetical protein